MATSAKQKLAARSAEQGRLSSVLFELTYRCNLDCYFCYNDLGLTGTALSTDQYLNALQDLAALNVLTVSLSGGEPLAHPDFFVIGARARELGFLVRIKSNGHAMNGAIAQRVREEVDPYVVEISLHGATSETHDRQTRVPGSFERLLTNLEEMKALGLRVFMNMPLTRWNEHELDQVVSLARRLELRLNIDPAITPKDNGDTSPLTLQPSRDAVERLFRLQNGGELPAHESAESSDSGHGPNCGAGLIVAAVDPFGSVFPCVQWRVPIGNLHQQRFSEIWDAKSQPLQKVRAINHQVGEKVASLGSAAGSVGACMGISNLEVGDPQELHSTAQTRLTVLAGADGRSSGLPIVS